jgi:NADPH2:quinone reductase
LDSYRTSVARTIPAQALSDCLRHFYRDWHKTDRGRIWSRAYAWLAGFGLPDRKVPILKAWFQVATNGRHHLPMPPNVPIAAFDEISRDCHVVRIDPADRSTGTSTSTAAFTKLVQPAGSRPIGHEADHELATKSLHIVVRHRGGPEVLEIEEGDIPEPGPGEVRIRVLAAGVSFAEMLMREGIHPERTDLPFIPGWDVVGVIDRAGSEVPQAMVGRRVAALPIHGGYAEHICLPMGEAIPVPEELDAAEAVSLVLNYVTAYQMMHRVAHAASGQTVLVHGASGGVGTALLQLDRLAGLEMYGTVSSKNRQTVVELGATPIDYESCNFVEEVRRMTDDGVDIVFDGVGGANVWRSFRALKPGGRVVVYGFTSFLKMGKLTGGARYRFRGVVLPLWYALRAYLASGRRRLLPYSIQYLKRCKPAWFREDLSTLLRVLREGKIRPIVAARIPLREARRAQELLSQGSVRGKIVLICGSRMSTGGDTSG